MNAAMNTAVRSRFFERLVDRLRALYVRHRLENIELDIRDLRRNPYAMPKHIALFESEAAEWRVELAILERRL